MELLIIFVLTLLNGFFALSEIALVSVKKSRIEHLAVQGSANAKTVLKLLDNLCIKKKFYYGNFDKTWNDEKTIVIFKTERSHLGQLLSVFGFTVFNIKKS